MMFTHAVTDVSAIVNGAQPSARAFAPVAGSLQGSEILRIAAEIRSRIAGGEQVCNLTVGDFDSRYFRIPRALEMGTTEALRRGETNYPPSPGMATLREAVAAFYERELGLRYPVDSILITSGSRPGVYGAYETLVGQGDRVVYGVPSWNNNYYSHMVSAVDVPVACGPDTAFMPTRTQLEPVLQGARLLALNSPLNPCGTAFSAESLGEICDLVLEENARRSASERPLYVVYDQVYWQLTFGNVAHVDPVTLRPEMAQYTVFVDGISKAFAATGLRVGWVVAPSRIVNVMNNVLQHIGTWAPRAEQVATASLLNQPDEIATFRAELTSGVQARLRLLHDGIRALRAAGHPVDVVEPMGAIYLSARFDLYGRTVRDGTVLRTSQDIRTWLLREVGLGVVPFSAFGSKEESGWCRLSVGAVSLDEIDAVLPRLRAGLEALSKGGSR
jgi:aspartate aminotransferase